jgi:dnd system-associated protein 4
MRDIRRPEGTEPLVERLTNQQVSGTDAPVFPTIMDLLIFCAGVGLSVSRRSPVASTGKAVPYRIFENNQKEGYIYLVALADKKDPAVLSGEQDEEIAKIFEEYAAAGLEEVELWISANPTDISGVQALIAKVQSRIQVAAPPPFNPSPL